MNLLLLYYLLFGLITGVVITDAVFYNLADDYWLFWLVVVGVTTLFWPLIYLFIALGVILYTVNRIRYG